MGCCLLPSQRRGRSHRLPHRTRARLSAPRVRTPLSPPPRDREVKCKDESQLADAPELPKPSAALEAAFGYSDELSYQLGLEVRQERRGA